MNPDMVIHGDREDPEDAAKRIVAMLDARDCRAAAN
jgi:hypothetical protein